MWQQIVSEPFTGLRLSLQGEYRDNIAFLNEPGL